MKNKIILVTAIAAALAPVAAMAEATIYGHLRYSINSIDSDDPAGTDGLVGSDNVSLFGFKASSEGDGVKAFVHLQTGAKADGDAAGIDSTGAAVGGTGSRAFTQRFYFGGLSGDFGKVAYGRMTNAYKFPGFKLDPFYNLSHVGVGGTIAAGGGTYGLSPATNGFTDNALQYTSPSMSGVKVNLGVYVDDGNNDEHGNNVGASYASGGFNIGVQLASNDTNTATVPGVAADGDAMRVHGGYKQDSWSAGFSFEQLDNPGAVDVDYTYLVGRFNATAETELVLTLGMVSDGAAEGSGFTGGVFQTVAPGVQVYASYSSASLDNVATGKDPSVMSVGAIHKF